MDQLQRFIDLVNKTGDKLVVFDRYQPEHSVVILGLNDYEELIDSHDYLSDLTEEELADKINGDIAIWKNEQVLSDFSEEDDLSWTEDDWSSPSELSVSEEELVEEPAEEELNYLYTEPEPIPPIVEAPDNYSVSEPTELTEPADQPVIPEESQAAKKPDFESLGQILESKFERGNSGNNWSIPSDRKRLAEDKFASRYETIGF